MKKVASSTETIIRLNGEKYYVEFKLSPNLKNGIAETLDAYEGLKDEISLFQLLTEVQDLVAKYSSETENSETTNN